MKEWKKKEKKNMIESKLSSCWYYYFIGIAYEEYNVIGRRVFNGSHVYRNVSIIVFFFFWFVCWCVFTITRGSCALLHTCTIYGLHIVLLRLPVETIVISLLASLERFPGRKKKKPPEAERKGKKPNRFRIFTCVCFIDGIR